MNRIFVAVLLIAGLFPAVSDALELKNYRASYGPLGATRYDKKYLPGDLVFISYEIEDLTLDSKTGQANYVSILELLDAQGKVLFNKKTTIEVMPQLGGNLMPGNLHLILGSKQAPGNYSIKLSIHDTLGKKANAFKYDFEVVKEGFGMIGVLAPAIAFPGQAYRTEFNLVNLGLDAKKKPSVEVNIRILDQAGKPVTASGVQILLPRDMPEDADLEKTNFVPLVFPLIPNRVGRFTIEINALDKISNQKSRLEYPFSVIDINPHVSDK